MDGAWKLWTEWNLCSVTCGGGLRNRSRECDEAKFNGTDCVGPADESQICQTDPCPSKYSIHWLVSSLVSEKTTKLEVQNATRNTKGGEYGPSGEMRQT